MLNHVFSALSQTVSIDQHSNALSVLNVVEKLEAQSMVPIQITTPFTGIPFEYHAITLWFNDGQTDISAKERLTLVTPTGQRLPPHEVGFKVLPLSNHRIIAKIPGIPFAGNGVYWMEISVEHAPGHPWEPVARVPLLVQVNMPPNNATSSVN